MASNMRYDAACATVITSAVHMRKESAEDMLLSRCTPCGRLPTGRTKTRCTTEFGNAYNDVATEDAAAKAKPGATQQSLIVECKPQDGLPWALHREWPV